MARAGNQKEIAFYYPGPMWHGSDWIKTLILFFDGVGILLPNYMNGKLEREDPATAIPLLDKGLLHVLEPEKIIDKKATMQLGETVSEMIESGAFDKLPKDTRFHEISYSRMGGLLRRTGRPSAITRWRALARYDRSEANSLVVKGQALISRVEADDTRTRRQTDGGLRRAQLFSSCRCGARLI